MKKIQDASIRYEMLRIYVKFAFKRFFRKIEIRGLENIPSNEPVIFAPNHQSGLIDPLAVLLFQHDPIVFMARADIFKSKRFRGFLRFLKITPIFRIRDGFENLTKNETQFELAKDILLDCKQLCLMPEGNQGNQRRLRPLVKGLFRIAFSAEEALDGKGHVKIIPVGINYSYYKHAGSDMVVTFGIPMDVKDYLSLYQQNPANALNVLRDELSARISPLMHDIHSVDNYDMIYSLCCYGTPALLESMAENNISSKAKNDAGKNFDARRIIGLMLDEMDAHDSAQLAGWGKLCQKLDKLSGSPFETTRWMESKQNILSCLLDLIVSIILLPGYILNYPALLLSRVINSCVEDTQIHTTISLVVGLVIPPLTYFIVAVVAGCLIGCGFGTTLSFIVLALVFGLLAERWRQYMRIPLRRLKYSFGKKYEFVKECRKDYQKLKEEMKKAFK